jgi:hypothetical protein
MLLTIRESQMDVLRIDRARRFEIQLLQILKAEYPGWKESYTERSLADLVHEAIVAARAMGVTWETELADFVGLYFAIGPGFQQHALVQAVFNDSSVAVNRKIETMFAKFTRGDWEVMRLEAKEPDRSAVAASN